MASRVISAEAAGDAQPMPWHIVGVEARQSLQYSMVDASTNQASETGVQVAQLRANLVLAEAEKDRLVREAHETGRRDGQAAGRQAVEAESHAVLQRLAASIQQVSELSGLLRTQAEGDLVRLAVAIAQRILHRELNVDSAVITGLVRVGLEKVRMQDVMRVRVCPDHVSVIKECLTRSGAAHVEVIPDSTQELGGVIFETSRGKLDVSIDTQLREIERGLTDRLKGQG
jgi:flagellar assembly protein FliH